MILVIRLRSCKESMLPVISACLPSVLSTPWRHSKNTIMMFSESIQHEKPSLFRKRQKVKRETTTMGAVMKCLLRTFVRDAT